MCRQGIASSRRGGSEKKEGVTLMMRSKAASPWTRVYVQAGHPPRNGRESGI